MRIWKTTIAGLILLLTALAMAGCYQPVDSRPSATTTMVLPKPGPRRVLVDSKVAYSGDESRPLPTKYWIVPGSAWHKGKPD